MDSIIGDITPAVDLLEVKKLQELVRCLQIQNEQLRSKNKSSRGSEISLLTNAFVRKVDTDDFEGPKRDSDENTENSDNNNDDNANTQLISNQEMRSTVNNFDIFKENEMINIDEMDLSDDESWLYTPPSFSPADKGSCSWLHQESAAARPQKPRGSIPMPVRRIPAPTPANSPSKIAKPRDSVRSRFAKAKAEEPVLEAPVIDPQEVGAHRPVLELTDVMEVKEIARLQEESLRQSSSMLSSSKKLHTLGRSGSSRSSISDPDQSDTFVSLCSGMTTMAQDNSDSDYSTPPESPYGSSLSIAQGRHSLDMATPKRRLPLRRSLPRPLVESKLALGTSDPKLPATQSAIPRRPATAGSPKVPRSSGLPRSTRTSSVPRPSRSGIPFKSSSRASAPGDRAAISHNSPV